MKRILILILVMVLTLGAITSCNLPFFGNNDQGGDNQGGGDTPATETSIEEAIKELDDMYKEFNGSATENDFELVASLNLDKTEFTITWTSSNANVKVELVDGFWVVDVPENVSEQFEYTLTANITTAGGQKATLTYNRVVPGGIGMISTPEVGVAYKFALLHGNEKAVVYFDGSNYNNYAWYLAYTTDVLSAVDVYLETVEGVEGGYRLFYNKDGEKTYIVAFPRDGDTTKGTLKLDTEVPAEYYTWNTEYNTLVYTSVTGEQFYIGSSGTYKSISLSAISYISGATSYVAHLYGPGGVKEELPEQELPEVPENYTSQDIVDALYKLQSGQTLEGPYEITGVITSIKYAYDPGYNNISVNIVVEGREDKPVLCYRLNGGETLKVGDTITIFAGVTNYNGTYETTSGGVIRNVIEGDGTIPEVPTPDSDGIVLDLTGNANLVSGSAEKNVFAANGITVTNDKAESTSDLTVQTQYAQRFYAKSTVKIEYPGMTKIVIDCDDYSDSKYVKGFDGMTVAGATITRENDIVTIIFAAPTDVFQSTALPSQIRCEKITVYTGEVEDPGVDPKPEDPTYTAPVAGQAYDLFMELPSGKVYFAGSMSGDYLATTTDAAASVKIYFEEVTGGYHIYFMNGDVKTYITAAAYLKSNGYAGCHFSLTTETPNLAWTYDTTYGIIEIYDEIDGKSDTFFAGTYGTYSTVSLSGAYYKDQISSGTQYPARLSLADGSDTPVDPQPPVHEHTFVDGKCECGETDPDYVPETPVEGEWKVVTELKTGDQVLIGAPAYGKLLSAVKIATYYNKGIDYSATDFSNVTNDEIWVVTVNADGTYSFTALSGDKLGMADANNSLNAAGPNYSWVLEDQGNGIFYVKNTGREKYLEWYASKDNWSTYSPANSDLFQISFYVKNEAGSDTPVEPETPHEHTFVEGKCECGETDPDYVPETPVEPDNNTISIPEALEIAKGQEHNTYTTEKYYITGTVTNLYNTTYGNFYIKDENGNEICIYGLFSEDGSVRYDAMDYKPVNGDVVTVYTVLGAYNTTYQGKNAWLVEVTAHEHNYSSSVTEPTCVADGYTTHSCSVCGDSYVDSTVDALGHTTEEGTCERCGLEVGANAPTVGTLAEFTFGANGTASHVDGNDYGTSKSFTAGTYTLALTGMSKVYGPAYDATGNSCIKLGTSKVVGTFSFTVPENVTEVVIYVAQYKSNTTKVNVNGVDYTISTASNNGEYTAITIDTSVTKTVVFATVSGGVRCMIDSIVFNGVAA